MKDEEYYNLLKSLDSPGYEASIDFDYGLAHHKFLNFVKELEEELQQSIKSYTGDEIQDAKFHSSFELPKDFLVDMVDINTKPPTLVFSNFGELVTLNNEEIVKSEKFSWLKKKLLNAGYIYIPTHISKEWWLNFFDYT